MAYAPKRSCTRELHAGQTDGAYKKAAPNRGGYGFEETFAHARRQMSGAWHGFNDTAMKVLPDGRTDHPPYYVYVTPEDDENI